MLRRLGLVFVFFGVISAAYASEPTEKDPEGCELLCMSRCMYEGVERPVCGYICGC